MSTVATQWKSDSTFKIEPRQDGFKPYEHQSAAWDALDKHFASKHAGVLVVPTGGGKTAIAGRWLLQHHLAKGGRVLWLAHRRSLLRQAFAAFAEGAHLAASPERARDTLSFIIVSSTDKSWSNVAPDHDVVFSSVQSAVRERSFCFLDQMVRQSPKGLFVVVDEAHHAAARSYQKVVLEELKKRLHCPVLGLTATPVRMDADDEKRMWNLFESVVYQIDKKTLINKKILADTAVETVKTGIEVEKEFTDADRAHLQKFGELSDAVLERLAKHAPRNKIIVDQYKKKSAEYGSTIVFAADTLHARTLADEFKRAKIDADYVDYTRGDSQSVMEAYRDKGKPQVIVNVEMLTEGFDAPRTRTVFIARPTRSEALVAQMIGRALRGTLAGGNDLAHLVTFVDTWKDFQVVDTEYVVNLGEVGPQAALPNVAVHIVHISNELLQEAYRLVQSNLRGVFMGLHQCLPHSWYVWEQELEDDIQRRLVLVFDNQKDGFARLDADFADSSKIPELSEAFGRELVRRYFGDAPDPLPRWTDILSLLEARKGKLDVQSYTFEEKKAFDPRALANRFYDENVAPQEQLAQLQKVFDESSVCKLVYRSDFKAFYDEVQDAFKDRLGPPAPKLPPTVVESLPRKALGKWPDGEKGYSLIELRDAVLACPKHFPKGAPVIGDLAFSKRPLSNLFGYFRYSDRAVVINSVLDSPDIPRFVLEFLLFHELLHADMPSAGHNGDFRRREHRFVPSEAAATEARAKGFTPGDGPEAWRVLADQFLDTITRYFDVPRMGM